MKLAIASYGRDGEDIDVITLKKKPRIFIPPDTYFVTAESLFEKSRLHAEIVKDTGWDTLLGKVKIYKSGAIGGNVELAGVNRGSRMVNIKELIPGDTELFLIDGALDRRSSAIPSLYHGMVLATGAVVGNTIDLIVERTMDEVDRLTLPSCNDRAVKLMTGKILDRNESGLIRDDKTISFKNSAFFGYPKEDSIRVQAGDIMVLQGALTDTFAETLLHGYKGGNCIIIVRDGTRVFLNNRNINLLKKKNIALRVYEPIKLIAVTVNPYSPYGFRVDSAILVESLKGSLREAGIEIPVFDVLSKDYP